MPYIPPSVVQEVKRMDLLTYLKNYEPYELVHFSGNTYTTRTHDSLKISNGKWMWWSQRTGGRSALDYLIKVRGYSFLEAVELLAVMLVNTQANKRMLQEMPHENMEDLSAICYVDFPVESNDGKATMKVKNEHLKMWNVDAKEMFRQARANTQPVNTPILQSMDEMLLSIFNEEGHATNLLDENVDFGLRSHDMLYALTNVEKQYGASMITQPEVLNKLEQLFPEGFYVLPSSVHEVLIVPDNGEMEPKMLGEMVREVNKNEVERQEVLSDRVYSYDKEKHQIRQEPDSIQQVKEMGR